MLTFAPVADAYVRATRVRRNYGTQAELLTGGSSGYRTYLKFVVQGLGTADSAVLRVFMNTSSSSGFAVGGVADNAWQESSIKYSNAPAVSAAVAGSSGATTAGQWVDVDVSSLVSGNGTVSMALTRPATAATIGAASREVAGREPRLIVTTTFPPPETTITSGVSGTHRSGSATFAFTANRGDATFECSSDGSAFTACTSPRTLHVPNGPHTFKVRALAGGMVDATPPTRSWWADATLQNGNFETPATGWSIVNYAVPGWKGYHATLSAASGGVAGPGAAVVTYAGTGSGFSMYSAPKPINATTAGRTYSATGSVRSDVPGYSVCMNLREWNAGAIVGSKGTCVTSSTSWKTYPALTYTASRSAGELELFFYQSSVFSGARFVVDGASVSDGSADPVTPAPGADPVLLALGDIAVCWSSGDEATARIVDELAGIVAIAGDTEQDKGTADGFAGCYDKTWGRHKARTRPAVGDHEYLTTGAGPYWNYFGSAAGVGGKGWYSYDVGSWHMVVLNSNCPPVGWCGEGTEQYDWLLADLAAKAKPCTAAYFHHPFFSSGSVHGSSTSMRPLWDALYARGAEFVFSGNDHNYQRFARQRPDGTLDGARGIRQFVVGTGGTTHYKLGPLLPNTEAANDDTYGVLELTLKAAGYDWRFVPQAGKTFTDAGSAGCSP